jgi:hypothetical protein
MGAGMNQLPTSTDNPVVPVPSIDDVGRTSGTIAFPCRRCPHPTGRRFAVKKSQYVAGVKKKYTNFEYPRSYFLWCPSIQLFRVRFRSLLFLFLVFFILNWILNVYLLCCFVFYNPRCVYFYLFSMNYVDSPCLRVRPCKKNRMRNPQSLSKLMMMMLWRTLSQDQRGGALLLFGKNSKR